MRTLAVSLLLLAGAVLGACGLQRNQPPGPGLGGTEPGGLAAAATEQTAPGEPPAAASDALAAASDAGPASEPGLAGSGSRPASGGNNAEVVRVVDGDTIVVRIAGRDERVRLIGIDTPESVNPEAPVECFGPESSARLAELLPPEAGIELVRDVEARDDFGRLLAYVFRTSDELFVNLAMVAEGYAGTLAIAPNTTFADDFDRAAAAARASRLGLWAACPDPDALFGSVSRR